MEPLKEISLPMSRTNSGFKKNNSRIHLFIHMKAGVGICKPDIKVNSLPWESDLRVLLGRSGW